MEDDAFDRANIEVYPEVVEVVYEVAAIASSGNLEGSNPNRCTFKQKSVRRDRNATKANAVPKQ